MNEPMEEIRMLAERVKQAKPEEEVGFTRRELEMIFQFSEEFWDEVYPKRKKQRERWRKRHGGTGSTGENVYV
jgi:hypothetical protein